MNSLDQLKAQIAQLEKELGVKKAALKILQWTSSPTSMGHKSASTRKKMNATKKKYWADVKAGRRKGKGYKAI